MRKLWSNSTTGQSEILREQTDDKKGKQTEDSSRERPTDMSWHLPILMNLGDEPFKNYRSRTSEK